MEIGNLIFGHNHETHPIDRGKYETAFVEFLDRIDCDEYGVSYGPTFLRNDRGGVTTDMFEVNPYWWGDEDNTTEINKPNFYFKPTDYKIDWYKYALRDSYTNQELNLEDFKHMLSKCAENYASQKYHHITQQNSHRSNNHKEETIEDLTDDEPEL